MISVKCLMRINFSNKRLLQFRYCFTVAVKARQGIYAKELKTTVYLCQMPNLCVYVAMFFSQIYVFIPNYVRVKCD